MTERAHENVEIMKLQKNASDLAALTALMSNASDMAFLGMRLMASADKITEIAGGLAERSGYSVEGLFEHLEHFPIDFTHSLRA